MGKPVLEEDEEEKGTMKHFVVTQLNKFFISHLPIDSFKDLPATYMYYFGTVAYIATIAMFIYFTKTSYDDAINQPYISIETGGGASCTSVPIAITDDYMADNKGNWVGTTNFVYSEAEFLITFNNFKVDSTIQYEDMMNAYQTGLVQIGEYTATQNLAQNLVYWMCYIRYYDIQQPSLTNFSSVGHGSLQYIQLTGDPAEVFDLGYVQGHIISKAGYCTESAFAYFDQANGMFVTNQNYSDFISKSECSSAINPLSFGYYPSIDQNVFQLGLDVYAFATAVAVNTGVLQIYDLGVASSEFFDFTYDNVTYRTGQYFDIRYPMMNTIVCIQNVTIIPPGTTGVDNLCMYQVGQTLAIPVFNHFGTNYEFPEYCDCDTNGKTSACQTFNLLAGLLFYPSDPDTPYTSEKQILTNTGIFDLLVLVTKNGGYANLNKNAYNASFAAAAPAYGQMSSNLDTVSWRKKAFNFCTLTTLSCTLLVFNAFDALSKKVSPFKYQLNNGSCHNSISVDSVYWDKLVQNTPTALTQSYYDCYQSPESALFSALGIASGNTSLAVPIVVMAILPLLYLLLVAIRQVPPKEEYSDPEKDQAIEILSILMLRLRDGKTRGVKKGGILMKLTQELITAAKEEGGYPDSDDEDDGEEAPTTKLRRKSSKAAKVSYAQSLEDKIDSDDEEERPSVLQNSSSNNNGNARKKSDEDSSIRPSQQFRRSSAKGLRKAPADKRERGKMAVFTRQLEEPKPTIFKRKSTTAGEDGGNRRRTSSAGGSGYLTSMFGAKPSSPTGGGGAREMELATYGDDATNPLSLAHYANASSPSLPKDLQIMNSEAMGVMPVNKFSKVLTGDDIDLLVDDLIKLFGEALKEGNRNPNANRETGAPFMQGKQLTMKLAKVVLSDLLERDDKTIFFKLSNALCMHASIDLKLEMREVGSKYSDRVAYNIGGKVLTISNLDRIM